ncbi:cold-shock protein [Sphingosinicella sp. LHD-64]|uniref:cold-shock protein n=1 Tax=Sphingosinicella sp. LHD-64 TaxID=3072139 RepID=UPI00280E3C74|nr:cold-shock protein [Sphingosinicella sp. LHD-64]MDQ8757980.1 cold-shock protein [Sphingosinicella sp. LHD-64]
MAIGTVKFFNTDRGYGFITNEAGGKDAFVHISAVERAGMATIREGQKLSYELEPGRDGKISAVNLAAAE